MKYIIYLLIGLFLLNSCTSNTIYEKPENLLSKKVMADILTDMYLAEGARSVQNKELERLVDYMPLVYEKYKIDSVRFAESNFYYTTRIDDYESIFKVVDNRLKEMKVVYDSIAKVEDSLRRGKLFDKNRTFEKPTLEDKKNRRGEIDEEEEDY